MVCEMITNYSEFNKCGARRRGARHGHMSFPVTITSKADSLSTLHAKVMPPKDCVLSTEQANGSAMMRAP